ncbi:alpha-tocopherol transfer protein-like isoform X1 [Anoplophora glabripennis]|uniref:alpha-tocopherol transfer protein-like isoform X1 n=1 Tax=Anoplophora glabripennis TaxID=217634 RepID=UPI0008747E60|nr:alpha-tocopherol transfer protein-like isoform X1 [Anoplophora glabripennis]
MSYFQECSDLKVKERVLQVYDKTLESFKSDVEGLKVWLKTQPHLPQVLNDRQIESFLILGKCNTEKVKSKIDMYFTLRARFPDVFNNWHPLSERIKQAQRYVCFVPMPKLNKDLNRVFIMKIKPTDNPMDIDAYACFAYLMNVVEIRFLEDMCSGHIIIFDLENVKIGHVVKMTPMFIKTIFIIAERSLTTRAVAVHLVNAPSSIDQTLFIAKTIIKPKLAERIIVHKGTDTAVTSLDKDVLPSDYGGNEKSLDDLEARFLKKFEEYKDFFDQREHWKVDEDLRPEKYDEDGFFGCYGNFKQLQVD